MKRLLCLRKYGDSILRLLHSISSIMGHFSWIPVLRELKLQAPILFSFLKAALAKRGRKMPQYAVCICASVLLKNRNKNLTLIQAIISIVMYAGHCSKQVSILLYQYVYQMKVEIRQHDHQLPAVQLFHKQMNPQTTHEKCGATPFWGLRFVGCTCQSLHSSCGIHINFIVQL